jgi:acetyltransferase-like isoleucine patch superfamily enzyme
VILAGRVHGILDRLRRQRFRARVALSARLASAHIDVSVARGVRIGRGVRVRVASGASGALHIGAHSSLGDNVEIRLTGGRLRIGEWVEIRSGAAFMVGGELELVGPNLVSWGVVIHCDERVHLAPQAVASEHVTITDSAHEHVDGAWHLDAVRTAPVAVGRDTWIGAKATITPGVTIGDRCVVGAGAVVTRPVPDDHVATGVPAQIRARTGA